MKRSSIPVLFGSLLTATTVLSADISVNMAAYGYHGTLAVESTGAEQARLIYTLVYDQESISPERRESERTRLQGRFQSALEAMKQISERR